MLNILLHFFPPTNWLELYVKSLICGFLDFFLFMVKSNHCIFETKAFLKHCIYIKSNIQPENFVKLDISKISIFNREQSILVSSNCSLHPGKTWVGNTSNKLKSTGATPQMCSIWIQQEAGGERVFSAAFWGWSTGNVQTTNTHLYEKY